MSGVILQIILLLNKNISQVVILTWRKGAPGFTAVCHSRHRGPSSLPSLLKKWHKNHNFLEENQQWPPPSLHSWKSALLGNNKGEWIYSQKASNVYSRNQCFAEQVPSALFLLGSKLHNCSLSSKLHNYSQGSKLHNCLRGSKLHSYCLALNWASWIKY